MVNKKKDYEQFSTTLPIKFIKLLRLHAFKSESKINDILELYQQAYLEKLEREKAEKKAAKEAKEKEQRAKNGETKPEPNN
jgi:hypothetical protein